jgi:hypothetical protein
LTSLYGILLKAIFPDALLQPFLIGGVFFIKVEIKYLHACSVGSVMVSESSGAEEEGYKN